MAYESKNKDSSDDTLHLDYIEELQDFQESDQDQREQARESDRFLLDKDGQWEDQIRQNLDSQQRPRYTFDKMTPVIESMMADVEDMDFGCNVKPDGNGSDKDLAETYEGMVRSIQNASRSDDTFRSACRRITRRGFDAWIVKAKYADAWSFEQDLFIEPIPNAVNRVWISNTSQKQDGSDSDVAYILSAVSPSKYKEQFPEGKAISIDEAAIDDTQWGDYQPEVIVIAERYYRKDVSVEVGQLSNGEVVEINEDFEKIQDERAKQGITLVKTKKVKDFKWYHCTFDGGGMLTEERETVFKSNPVVPVYGNYELLGQNSKVTYSGIVLKGMDAQRVHNYAKSREIEEGALAPRAKWWMTKKQAKGNENQISRMNTSADPVQFYTPDPEAPQPYYGGGAQINPHLSAMGAQMGVDIKEQAGVFDAMQGQFAGRQSEDSVRMQIDRGTASTRKWVNALVVGIRRTCEILVETIPVVYDTKRQFTITGIDGSEEQVVLNEEIYDVQSGQMIKSNNLNAGKYKVVCEAGPAFSNKLEAGLNALLEYAAIDPTIVAQGGDIMLKAIDAPLVDKIAERKRASMLQQGMIPPSQMTEEEQQEMLQKAQQPQQPDANMVLAQAEQLKAQADIVQAQTDQLEAQHKIQNEQAKRQIDVFKAQTDRMGTQVDAAEAGAKIDHTRTDAMGKQLDNIQKTQDIQERPSAMSDEQLFNGIRGGE